MNLAIIIALLLSSAFAAAAPANQAPFVEIIDRWVGNFDKPKIASAEAQRAFKTLVSGEHANPEDIERLHKELALFAKTWSDESIHDMIERFFVPLISKIPDTEKEPSEEALRGLGFWAEGKQIPGITNTMRKDLNDFLIIACAELLIIDLGKDNQVSGE